MDIVYNENTFYDQLLICPKCNWQGSGSKAVIIDFFGVVDAKEIHCPNCDERLGILKDNDEDKGGSDGSLSFQIG